MSQSTMSSHLESSWRIFTEAAFSPVWLTSEFPPYCHTILMGTSSFVLVGLPLSSTGTLKLRTPNSGFSITPELNVSIFSPCSMASSHENTEIIFIDGFGFEVVRFLPTPSAGEDSRAPLPPPGIPTLPVTQASRKIAREAFSPFAWRCGPQPWVIAQGFAVAISRASWRMVCSGTPVMAEAHWGVFSMPSFLPSM